MLLLLISTKNAEKEIFEATNECTDKGDLNEACIGWARNPLFNCNLSGHWPRKKKWNYWYTANEDCLFSATISNIDYAGMVFIYFLDFKTKKFIEKTITTPLGRGCRMPDNVNETVVFKNSELELSLLHENSGTHILASCKDFGGYPLSADIIVSPPEGNETLNVIIPWNKRTFQFTSKQEGLPSVGTLNAGDLHYEFESGKAFSCLDFGRGIWPYNIAWNWATASGMENERRLGLNLGAKWTDGTGLTENGVFVDGRLTKISEDLAFDYDEQNYMKNWAIKSKVSDSIDLSFTPFYERIAKSNFLVIKSEVHQMVGYFSGHIKTESGETVAIEQLLGCAEAHVAKW